MLYEHKISNTAFNIASLNPYYDGICSMRGGVITYYI